VAPTDPLFQQLHRYFQGCLGEADAVILIGYAFRDEYINAILERDTPRQSQVVVLNPAERLPGIPYPESRVLHLRRHFDAEGVAEVLASLGEGNATAESA